MTRWRGPHRDKPAVVPEPGGALDLAKHSRAAGADAAASLVRHYCLTSLGGIAVEPFEPAPAWRAWIPAFAGMTEGAGVGMAAGGGRRDERRGARAAMTAGRVCRNSGGERGRNDRGQRPALSAETRRGL